MAQTGSGERKVGKGSAEQTWHLPLPGGILLLFLKYQVESKLFPEKGHHRNFMGEKDISVNQTLP